MLQEMCEDVSLNVVGRVCTGYRGLIRTHGSSYGSRLNALLVAEQ